MTFPVIPLFYTYCDVCNRSTTTAHAREHVAGRTEISAPPSLLVYSLLTPVLLLGIWLLLDWLA